MIDLLGMLALTIATVAAIANYIDSMMEEEDQRLLLRYLRPKPSGETDQSASYQDALRSVLRVFVSGAQNRFDTLRSLVVLQIIMLGTVSLSILIVHYRLGDIDPLIPSAYTAKNLIFPYAVSIVVSVSFGVFSIYQTTIFYRLFTDAKGVIERALLFYSDIALSLSIVFLTAFVSITTAAVIVNHSVETEVFLVLAEDKPPNGPVGLNQLIVGDGPGSTIFSNRKSSSDGDMLIGDYLAYIARANPSIEFLEADCATYNRDFVAKHSFYDRSTEKLDQKCFNTTIRRPIGSVTATELMASSFFASLLVTGTSALVGVYDLIYYQVTSLGIPYYPPPTADEAPRSRELFKELVSQFPLANNSQLQASLVLSPFIMSSFYFTILIYVLAAVIFLARKSSSLLYEGFQIPLLNPKKPILSLSLYVCLVAMMAVCFVFFSTS
ncbi:MAG: hypothetical protein AAGH90_12010 [Pseudomonadota bacterium]